MLFNLKKILAMKKTLIKIIATIFLVNISAAITAQAKLVMNGGIINITNGGILLIENSDNTAIIYNGSGYIKSEGLGNQVVWNIGAGNGNIYLIPFGNASNYLPIKFNASSGVGANGRFVFSTYPTPTWKNSDYLPNGVTNINANGSDNSAKVIDRFWQIEPQLYTTRPNLTNLIFTYSDAEYSAPNNINESSLISQCWNYGTGTWNDYIPPSTINTTLNTVTVPSITGDHIYNWWTLVDASSPLPVTQVNFSATVINKKVITSWQTASEINIDRFEIYRSQDRDHFNLAGQVAAAGNSNTLLKYKFTDNEPFAGASYYKLKIIDRDGKYVWSNVVYISFSQENAIMLYPNPSRDYITLQVDNNIVDHTPMATIYDAKGSLVNSFKITSTSQQINISRLPDGNYQLIFKINNDKHTLPFIKK
jgi:hypothetical protein